jgi:DNA-binding MarR family transcriptional regulator
MCHTMPPPKKSSPRTGRRNTGQDDTDILTRLDTRIDSLGYALRRAQVRSYEMFHQWLGESGLSPARVTALSIIASQPDTNQAELARQLGISGPTVFKLVDALEESGLICRMDVATDRRRYALALTAIGRTRMAQIKTQLDAYELRLAEGLSANERKQLLSLLERVAR